MSCGVMSPESFTSALQRNSAVTAVALEIVKLHAPLPAHVIPDQPTKRESLAGAALSANGVPDGNDAEQAVGQSMPIGALVTVPRPEPVIVTVSSNDGGCGHGFGVHVPSGAQSPAHPTNCVTVHAPSRQHEPGGCGHGFTGVQLAPLVQVPLVQPAWSVTMHCPSSVQQVPDGAAHGFGSHAMSKFHVLSPVHWSWVTIVQAPIASQHAPVGWAQGFGVHAVPAPWKTPTPAQTSDGAVKQIPSAQHAPDGSGQGLGEQSVRSP